MAAAKTMRSHFSAYINKVVPAITTFREGNINEDCQKEGDTFGSLAIPCLGIHDFAPPSYDGFAFSLLIRGSKSYSIIINNRNQWGIPLRGSEPAAVVET